MAITIPNGCFRQPTESHGVGSNGENTLAYVLKGPYQALDTLMDGLQNGDEIVTGWVMSSASLSRSPGNTGILTIMCAEDADSDDSSSASSENSTKALKELWSLRSVRNDVSIYAYCGPSPKGNPLRSLIEAWQKEPDGELAEQNAFTKPDGSTYTISVDDHPATLELMAKIRKGADSVMRFYPQLTRTRTYSKPPATVYENLACIDTPSVGNPSDFEQEDSETGTSTTMKADTKRLIKPGNLSDIIESHVWLKCQDDCGQTADGKYTRTESWIGILSSEGGWDENFYGKDTDKRWAMPYLKNS